MVGSSLSFVSLWLPYSTYSFHIVGGSAVLCLATRLRLGQIQSGNGDVLEVVVSGSKPCNPFSWVLRFAACQLCGCDTCNQEY